MPVRTLQKHWSPMMRLLGDHHRRSCRGCVRASIGPRPTDALVMLLLVACLAPGGMSRAADFETLLVIEPTSEHPRNSEGDIVQLADGRLCLAYTRFTGGTADHSAADIVARTSDDGGKTWSADRVIVPNEGQANVMSVSFARLKTGELLLFYLRKHGWDDLTMFVRRSTDELATLSEPVRVTLGEGYHVVNNGRVVQLRTGRLVVPAALHPCLDGTAKTFQPRAIMRVFFSDDGGRTWQADAMSPEAPSPTSPMLQEPGIIELKDGRLMMYIRTNQGTQYECFSDDAGAHWTAPGPGPLSSPLSPATVGRVPWTGDLLAVWNDHSGWHVFPAGKRTPLCLAVSRDDGRTWSPSRVIEGDPDGWYCYTSMTFVGDRVILSYCAGDSKVGGLNRLKVVSVSREWLYPVAAKDRGEHR